MFGRMGVTLGLIMAGLSLVAFSSPMAAAEESGNPWWMWLLVLLVLAAFAVLLVWWWRGSHEKDDAQEQADAPPSDGPAAGAVAAVDEESRDADVDEQVEIPSPAEPVAAVVEDVEEEMPADVALDSAVEATRVTEAPVQLALDAEEPEPEAPPEPDDLRRIEGIGPKISSVLQDAGVATFARLATMSPDDIRRVLGDANPNLLRLADPTTWPQQAALAASGDWDALEKLQDALSGGRAVSPK